MNIGIIGAGHLGKALITGLHEQFSVRAGDVFSGEHKGVTIEEGNNTDIVSWADVVFLCVKPQFMDEAIEPIQGLLKNKMVVSVAAGLPLSYYATFGVERMIRIMPTIALNKGQGVIGYTLGRGSDAYDEKKFLEVLSCLGVCFKVSEEGLDVITGISGSGIAYLLKIIDLFVKVGEDNGLRESKAIMIETLKGAVSLLEEKEISESLEDIASKGGTTEKGLVEMEQAGMDVIITNVVEKTIEACGNLRRKEE